MTAIALLLGRLRRETGGVAMTELALAMPFLLVAGMWGTETANLAITHMRLNQLASHIADNASRIGDTSTLSDRKIYEADINDLIYGAGMQSGLEISLYKHGRVIISGLQVDEDTGGQFIKWQRCKGEKNVPSTFGNEGDGLGAAIDGMGPDGEEVVAQVGDGVVFVEITYDYQPLIGLGFGENEQIHTIASFTVRDDRDLSQIYQRDPGDPDDIADCAMFDSSMPMS